MLGKPFFQFDSKRAAGEMENIKILKEKTEDGKSEFYTVTVNMSGHSLIQRFSSLKNAYEFIKAQQKTDSAYYNRKGSGVFSRKHTRVPSLKLISYECMDDQQQLINQGMGRTLNISPGGVLLETYNPVDTKYNIKLALGLGDDLVEVEARVCFCKESPDGTYEAGIEFINPDKKAKEVIRKLTIKD